MFPKDFHNIDCYFTKNISAKADEARPYSYYELMQTINFINCNDDTPTITEDMLGRTIPAYEFLNLMYKALFVDIGTKDYYGRFRYVTDLYSVLKDGRVKQSYEFSRIDEVLIED